MAQCTGQLLQPWQRPIEIAATAELSVLMGVGAAAEEGITALGLGTGGSLDVVGSGFSASEQGAARYMAARGNNVVLRAANSAEGRTSDLLVNGKSYDVYSPTTGSANRIISAIAKKNSQAEGVVLDLARSSVTRRELGDVLARVQGAGATNIRNVVIMP